MTTKKLEDKMQIISAGCGTFYVYINGKRHYSNNALAYDRITEQREGFIPKRARMYEYTYKQALEAFYRDTKKDIRCSTF